MDPSYIKSLDFDWSKPELSLKGEPKGLMITDCKSLYDLITKNAVPNSPECRTTIEIVLLKKQSRDHTACRVGLYSHYNCRLLDQTCGLQVHVGDFTIW